MAKGRPRKEIGDRIRIKATFVVFEDTKRKLDFIRYSDKKDLSEIAEEAFRAAIDKFEKKNGPIKIR